MASAARGLGLPTVDLGCFDLRNIIEPVELFQIELIPPVEAVSIDPAKGLATIEDIDDADDAVILALEPLSGIFAERGVNSCDGVTGGVF